MKPDKTTQDLIEDFGKIYADFGQPMLRGRIVGLLLASEKPLSLNDICRLLGITKGPVSIHTRQLAEMGFLRKMWVTNDRKDYYQLTHDFFILNSRTFYQLHKNSLQIAEKYLKILLEHYEKAKPAEQEKMVKFGQRILEMKFFYERVVMFYKKFIDEWPSVLKTIPRFEEYAQQKEKAETPVLEPVEIS